MTWIARLIEDRNAATAIEYSLIAALIAIAIMGSVTLFASRTSGMWNYVSATLTAASG